MNLYDKFLLFIHKKISPQQRDFVRGIKRFAFRKKVYPQKQLFIFFVDGKFIHGGMADRFKGIISTFLFCLQNDIEFRIKYTFPFELSDYLLPNKYNWQISDDEKISFNYFEAKYIYLIGDNNLKRLTRLNTKKQIHCYANRDITDELNILKKTDYSWGELFFTLFKPSQELSDKINHLKNNIGSEYISVVFRFQNLLGDFVEYDYQPNISNKWKNKIISKCRRAILDVKEKFPEYKILATSDSQYFLSQIQNIHNVFSFPEKVVHIDSIAGEKKEVFMKSFVDFYMIANSQRIYSIGTEEMYRTEFPMYAAKLYNIPFERILID